MASRPDYFAMGARGKGLAVPHAGTGFVAAILIVVSAAHAAAEPAVTQSRVNLRSGPGPAFAPIVLMPAGVKLDAQKCSDEWCRVKYGRQVGYASRALLRIGTDSYASAAPQAAPVVPQATQSGPRVWQWRNSDWRNDHWRRLEWHNRLNGR
jgi:uncharacterized protein YraI